MRTHHRHVGGNPATDAEADNINRRQALLFDKPMVKRRLMGNRRQPFRAWRRCITRMRRRIDGGMGRQRLMEGAPALMPFDSVQHQQWWT